MKKWLDLLATIWVGLSTHKLRSFLTILGIVIGVAAVISLMSIGRGVETDVISRIERLGSDLVFVRPSFFSRTAVRSTLASLTLEDARAIREQVPYITSVAPSYQRSLQVVVRDKNMNVRVTGITPEYQEAYNLQTNDGALLTEYECERGMRVAVLGAKVKQTLFEDDNAVGQPLRIGGNIVRVAGVLQSKGESMQSADDAIFIPLTALQRMVAQQRTSRGEYMISSIVMKLNDRGQSKYVVDEITSVLRLRHQLPEGVDNDFTVTSMEEMAKALSETVATMTIFLGAIAAVSLLVGGIGVMNIMLVSVLERTREIGIRKALGARERDIWIQFLIEAAVLTFVGGIIGVILGYAISLVVPHVWSMTTAVSPDIVILAVAVSVGIGLFFGFYPAWNASRLNPIEALRSE